MKKFFELCFIFVLLVCFTGCIEVTRGYRHTVFMKVEGESKSSYAASPALDINADKEYSDAFKSDTDASQNKSEDKEKEIPTTTEVK